MADSRDLAERLRREAPRLDDLSRARMERRLLEAAAAPVVDASPGSSRRPFAAGVMVGLAAAAAVLALWSARERSGADAPGGEASFEALRDGVLVRRGSLHEGEAVETGVRQLLRVAFGATPTGGPRVLIAVQPQSRLRLGTLSESAVEVQLERGRTRFEFHPLRRGEESLRVRTPTALIEVVGTVFEVVVERQATLVEVTEGVVRVTPLGGGEPVLVRAGQLHRVGAEPTPVEPGEDSALGASGLEGSQHDGEEAETLEPRSSSPLARQRGASRRRQGDSLESPWVEQSALTSDTAATRAGAETRAGSETSRPVETVPLSDDVRFDLAARYFEQGRWEDSRHELYAIVRTSESRISRTRAWTEVAETFERQGDPSQAAEAYRRAALAGRGTTLGANALFSLGRLRASLHDVDAARSAYRRYLEEAPAGPLAEQAARALCRLGERERCDASGMRP